MIKNIKEYIQRFVHINDEDAIVLAHYVLHTWAFKHASATPYLYVHSAVKRSGKTRLLEVLEVLVREPIRTANISSAALFHVIETFSPTMLVDEVDTVWTGASNDTLRGILNAGYKSGAYILRRVGDDTKKYDVFAPKVLAGIHTGHLPGTIADRSIPIELERKSTAKKVDYFFHEDAMAETEPLRVDIEKWVDKLPANFNKHHPKMLKDVTDRQWEISRPLISIGAKLRYKDTRDAFSEVLHRPILFQQPESEIILNTIKGAFDEIGSDRIFTEEIVERLGEQWTGAKLGNALSDYLITPTTVRRGNSVRKGYKKEFFKDLFEKNL